jgi:hypothetical protein
VVVDHVLCEGVNRRVLRAVDQILRQVELVAVGGVERRRSRAPFIPPGGGPGGGVCATAAIAARASPAITATAASVRAGSVGFTGELLSGTRLVSPAVSGSKHPAARANP